MISIPLNQVVRSHRALNLLRIDSLSSGQQRRVDHSLDQSGYVADSRSDADG